MSSTTRRLVQAALMAALLASCTTTGTLNGRVAVPDTPAAAVVFTYTAAWARDGGTMSTRLPSGESFSGPYVPITSTSTVAALDPSVWALTWIDWGPSGTPRRVCGPVSTCEMIDSVQVVATLYGDQGDVMHCRFGLHDPEHGMPGGGVGQCQVSNGSHIEARFGGSTQGD